MCTNIFAQLLKINHNKFVWLCDIVSHLKYLSKQIERFKRPFRLYQYTHKSNIQQCDDICCTQNWNFLWYFFVVKKYSGTLASRTEHGMRNNTKSCEIEQKETKNIKMKVMMNALLLYHRFTMIWIFLFTFPSHTNHFKATIK